MAESAALNLAEERARLGVLSADRSNTDSRGFFLNQRKNANASGAQRSCVLAFVCNSIRGRPTRCTQTLYSLNASSVVVC